MSPLGCLLRSVPVLCLISGSLPSQAFAQPDVASAPIPPADPNAKAADGKVGEADSADPDKKKPDGEVPTPGDGTGEKSAGEKAEEPPKASSASETDAKTRCAVAYESAQEARAAGELKRAQENLVVCAQSTCAAFIQSDCSDWLTAVQRDLPSVVFSAKKSSGEESLEASVVLDGQLVAPSLDGRAVPIDPGVHEFEFALQGFPKVKRRVVIRQGEKNRVIGVVFNDEGASEVDQQSTAAAGSSSGSSARPWAYVAWGVGASALAGAFFLNNSARSQEDEFLTRCDADDDGNLDQTPGCQDGDLSSAQDKVDTKLLLSAISLGTGIAGVIGGTVLFFLSRDAPRDQDAGLQVQIAPRGRGGFASVSATF